MVSKYPCNQWVSTLFIVGQRVGQAGSFPTSTITERKQNLIQGFSPLTNYALVKIHTKFKMKLKNNFHFTIDFCISVC